MDETSQDVPPPEGNEKEQKEVALPAPAVADAGAGEGEGEGAEEGGVEIAPPPPPALVRRGLSIGDTILILGGQLNETRGKLYGFQKDRFTILPDGVSDRVIHIALVNGKPDPELGIRQIVVLQRAVKHGFVFLVDLHADSYVEMFATNGEPAGTFYVSAVDPTKDSATFQVLDESGKIDLEAETFTITFDFQGIPRDMPYEVIRTREPPAIVSDDTVEKKVLAPVPLVVDDEDHAEGLGEAKNEEDEDEEDDEIIEGEEIEIPVSTEGMIMELGSAEKIYDDATQRSEMLVQLIRMLPLAKQRDAKELQNVRRLVEVFMHMRNRTVKYGVTGEPRGLNPTTVQTLAELIQSPNASMVKKVAAVTKVLYMDHSLAHKRSMYGENQDIVGDLVSEDNIPQGHLYADYLEDILKKAESLLQQQLQENEDDSIQFGLPKFYRDMRTYTDNIQAPFLLEKGKHTILHDEEVFRQVIPDRDEPQLIVRQSGAPYKGLPVVTQSAIGMSRLLTGRKVENITVEESETPIVSNLLIFPHQAKRELGSLRSGSLSRDVATSMLPPRSMARLLESIKPIDDHPTVNDIINIGVNGQLGNINLADWLREQALPLNGVNDAYMDLQGYGIRDYEFTKEQMSVLQELIEQHLAALKLYMINQRQTNAAMLANLKYQPQPLLPDSATQQLLDAITSEPILQEVLENAENTIGDLANVDLNWFAFVFLKNPDLVSAVLGKGATMETQQAVVRERNRVIRDRALESLSAGYRLKLKLKGESQPDPENQCTHVADLQACRRIAQKDMAGDDDPLATKKMKLLLQFLGKYRGKTENDWVHCKQCGKHLLCGHELMMIQEFIKPRESDVLHKEMLLKFSGGQFSGKFICRVCGQAIQNLDFDTHLEFDDEGRPMMGRAVMEDEAGIEEDALKTLLGGDADLIEEVNFGNAELNQMYRTFHDLARQIGIQPEEADYRQMIDQLSTYMKTLKPLDSYTKAKKLLEAKGKQAADYPVYVAIRYASAACAILLLSIQTRQPDYVIYYSTSECEEGFMGYPLTQTEESTAGVNCLVNIGAAIQAKVYPWDTTTLQNERDVMKRKAPLKQQIMARFEELLKLPTVQAKLVAKREYLTKVLGKGDTGISIEQIASTFRPLPLTPATKEEAAQEAASNIAVTPEQKAVAWIRSANLLAKDNANINPKSPYSIATCCLHTIQNPNEFWGSHTDDLPNLEARTLGKPSWRSTSARTTFYTDPNELLEGTLSPDEYFKLFAKICFEGPNVGLPHEFGLTFTCTYCGLLLQQDPTLVSVDLDEKSRAEQRLRSNLEEQGVIINTDTFQNLLHIAQRRQQVLSDPVPIQPRREETIIQLSLLEYPPLENWSSLLEQLQINLLELEKSEDLFNEDKIFTASEELQNAVIACEKDVIARLGKSVFDALQSILTNPPREAGSMLRTYLLIPFQRWLSGITNDNFYIPKSYDLSYETKEDILVRGLGEHLKSIGQNNFTSELKGVLKRKVSMFVKQLSSYCNIVFPVLRPMTTLGGSMIVDIFMRSFCIGSVYQLINPNYIPPGDEEIESGSGHADMKQLLRSVAICLSKYAKGSHIPNDMEIKLKLEQRQEAENQKFVKKLDKMSKDRRQVELANKRLGIGDWAVGGTRAIMEYDPARYLEERLERSQAGLVDYQAEGMNMNDTDYQQVREDDY
jgi:hypothetical protein